MALSPSEELELLELEEEEHQQSTTPKEETSLLGAGLSGAGQGLFGLGDEAYGAMKEPMGALKQIGQKFGLADENGEDVQNYRAARDKARTYDAKAASEHPGAYYPGMIATGLASAAATGGGLPALVAGGIATGVGSSHGEDLMDDVRGGAVGGAVAPAAGAVLGAAKPVASEVMEFIANRLGKSAGRFAETATGATRVQAQKFRPGTGQELLDRGAVRAFDKPGDIATRTRGMMDESLNGIDDVLGQMDEAGVSISKEDLIGRLRGELDSLASNEAQAGKRAALEKILAEVEQGPAARPASAVEQVKRDFTAKPKYGTVESDALEAKKAAGGHYREAVEDSAEAFSPEANAAFKADKETYGLLSPVQDAAEKRQLQLDQAPLFGLNDMATAGASGAVGGPLGAIAGTVGRRVLAPRMASTAAVGMNALSGVARKTAEALKSSGLEEAKAIALSQSPFAEMLSQAANRGPQALATTTFLLSQTDEAYRRYISGEEQPKQSPDRD